MTSHAVVAAIVRAATENGIGVRVHREADRLPDLVLAEVSRALVANGLAVLNAATDLASDRPASAAGRHVALICEAGADSAKAASFVRWLGRTSPRNHFVLLLGRPRRWPSRNDDSMARERAWALEPARPGPSWLRRAEASKGRRRFAAAERWFRAAMSPALARGNEETASLCCERLVDLLVEQRQPRRAWPVAIALADKLAAYGPRSRVLTAAAGALMVAGEFDRAEALLVALEAEAQILDEEWPPHAQACSAELSFWRGRFDRAPPIAGLRSAAAIGWCGLAAWARGDDATLGLLEGQLRGWSRGEWGHELTFWAATLAALASAPNHYVDDRVDPVVTAARRTSSRLRSLARAIAAELVLTAGRPERALEWLGAPDGTAPAVYALLHEWLRARCHRDADAARTLRVRICRAGVEGVLRWGEGKDGMHLIHGLPALLQLVQDADDDHAALKGGCAWLRRQTGADGAAILTADSGRVIASDGWSGGDVGEPRATAPIRSSRTVIGQVVARGPEHDRQVIEQGVHAVAALLAPAVRSRLDALELSRDADRAVAEILGASPGMAAVRDSVARAALTGFPVLIEGESGTGKELVARAVHRLSARRDRPFAAVNCAALTDDLIEAELFGHARGAFTGALGTRAGLFEWAHGGTLFLDEVGELSPRGQAKVLRALQEREIRRVGENSPRSVDVRVVAATNVVLAEAATHGTFRQDLLYRLAVVRIRLPPLRERIEDIPRLAHAFWKPVAAERGVRTTLGADALAALCRHRWPGNVRELQNAIAGLVVAAPARGRVAERHVRQVLAMAAPDDPAVSLEAARRLAERRAVTSALARHGGRRTAAASELGISRQGLAKALRRLGLSGFDARAGVA